jgi:Domain of unknown function (DUF4160)
MPTVAVIDGIRSSFISMSIRHHTFMPSTRNAEYRAVIRIDTLKVIYGGLPKAAERKIIAWAKLRTGALHKAWETCRLDGNPGTIK